MGWEDSSKHKEDLDTIYRTLVFVFCFLREKKRLETEMLVHLWQDRARKILAAH